MSLALAILMVVTLIGGFDMPMHLSTAPGAPPRITDIQLSSLGDTDAERAVEAWISPLGRTDADFVYRYGNRYAIIDRGYIYVFDELRNITERLAVGATAPFGTGIIAAANGKVYILDGTDTVRVFTAQTGVEIPGERINIISGVVSMTIPGFQAILPDRYRGGSLQPRNSPQAVKRGVQGCERTGYRRHRLQLAYPVSQDDICQPRGR